MRFDDAVIDVTGETCSILYNTCYGGFSYSKEAIDEYNRRKRNDNPNAEPLSYHSEIRNDPLMIQLFHEYGSTWLSGPYAKIGLATFPARFHHSLQYHEYDGKEGFTIDYQTYFAREVKRILSSEEGSMEEIRSLYHEYSTQIEKGW